MSSSARVVPSAYSLKSGFAQGFERAFLLLAFAAVIAFYGWTMKTTLMGFPPAGGEEGDYYNLLSLGFLDGHTYLKREVPAALVNAEDPYDPAKRPAGAGMHDVSYYKGRYYLYFGAAPVVALYVPFRILAGFDLPMPYGNWLFISLGFLAASDAWLTLRRRFFPGSRTWIALLGVLALGCCGMTLSLVRRPSIWELPISAGYAFAMLSLAFLVHGFLARRRVLWFLLAGTAMGVAVGARPSYVVGGLSLPLMAVLLWWIGRRNGQWRWLPGRNWWAPVLTLGGSFVAVVLALLFYNYARFHNPLEFGLNYQLTGTVEARVRHFSFGFMPFNGYIYFLAPAQWGRYFPFVQLIRSPAAPAGYYGIEYPYGVLTNMPLTLLAVLWPLALLRRGQEGRRQVLALGLVLTAFFVAMAVFLCGFVTGAQRYMSDFTPALVLLGCLGLLTAERLLDPAPKWIRMTLLTGLGGLAAFSVFFGVMTSFQLHGLLRYNSPRTYARLARAFNLPVYFVERAAGTKYGPLELTVKFKRGHAGKFEPLLTTGWEFFSDHLYVLYLDDHTLRIGLDHVSRGTKLSAPIELDFDAVHRIRVEMGSLYPPEDHPFFAGKTELEKASFLRWLRVIVDGKPVIESSQDYYDASPECIQIGKATSILAYGDRFSGEILSVKRVEYSGLSEPRGVYGPLVLQLLFPRNVTGRSEPLVVTGVTGKADTLFVRYVDEDTVRFGYDHWGVGLVESGDVKVQHDTQQRLEIRMPSLLREIAEPYSPLRSALVLQLDDQVAWSTQVEAYPCLPTGVAVGINSAQASTCEPSFSGMITSIARERDTTEPKVRDPDHARMRLVFPGGRQGMRDPVFVRGQPGAADVVYVVYVDATHVRFGWDHWAVGATESPVLALDYSRIHELELQFRREAPDRSLVLRLDGVEVLAAAGPVYPAAPDSVTVGLNRIGASTCGERFQGALLSLRFPEKTEP